jgi:hypothetical protein
MAISITDRGNSGSKYPTNVPKIKSSKTKKPYKGPAHTAESQKGMGDYYGSGIVAKIGRMRSGMGYEQLSPKELGTPPRSVV